MPEHLMCTDRAVISAYGAADDAYVTWLDDVTDQLRDLGADPAAVRAFYSHDGYTTIEVPVIDPAPVGWMVHPGGTEMCPLPGAAGQGAREWLDRWETHPEPIRVLVAHGLPPLAYTPGDAGRPGAFARPIEVVFDDVVLVTTGVADRFQGRVGPAWSPIPGALLDAILVEHGEAPTVAA
ncbi:hypothetical protein [Cellulomonas aerilata]|uniref:Uncharacterized protein n=1 Tax=Cellulomonas aerilata TaxID=515326 RepID=A0A512DEV5_9CELL|nr:hypothetical protein [Cellulomonas aerilata]GEO34770.1 hypothetical protein CAE01nite_24950 [Cellulomonas aerilata]